MPMTEPSDHPTQSQVRGEAGTSVTSLAHLIPQLEDQRIKNLLGALIKTAPHLRGVQIGSIFLFFSTVHSTEPANHGLYSTVSPQS